MGTTAVIRQVLVGLLSSSITPREADCSRLTSVRRLFCPQSRLRLGAFFSQAFFFFLRFCGKYRAEVRESPAVFSRGRGGFHMEGGELKMGLWLSARPEYRQQSKFDGLKARGEKGTEKQIDKSEGPQLAAVHRVGVRHKIFGMFFLLLPRIGMVRNGTTILILLPLWYSRQAASSGRRMYALCQGSSRVVSQRGLYNTYLQKTAPRAYQGKEGAMFLQKAERSPGVKRSRGVPPVVVSFNVFL